jgi:alanine racemase
MPRPTKIICDPLALLHNLNKVRAYAPKQKIIAMVKANAYGCGIENVIPALEGQVEAFGVASFEEAMAIRRLGARTTCILLQGVFDADELVLAVQEGFECVIHTPQQLTWLLKNQLPEPIRIWIKVDTGMHRLGFNPKEIPQIVAAVSACSWIAPDIGLMTHFASADEPSCVTNQLQLQSFNALNLPEYSLTRSLANSAAILAIPEAHGDVVRPGIMLYGVSPFSGKTGQALGLKPVMRFESAISAIHHYPPHSPIGYRGTWFSDKPSVIGVVPVGYADGYPRHIQAQTPTWVNGAVAPVVGRVSMDMLTIDLTSHNNPQVGDTVELWGEHIPVEVIAESAHTIAYELLTKITPRARKRING